MTGRGYLRNRKLGLLHRVILKAPLEIEVDHIDGNKLNNHRSNLRFATSSQNKQNVKIKRTNSSGFIGVDFDKQKGLWRARIKHNRGDFFCGYFKSPRDAAKSRDEFAKILHKDFASLNYAK